MSNPVKIKKKKYSKYNKIFINQNIQKTIKNNLIE